MRQTLVIVATGVLSGVAGAIVMGHYTTPRLSTPETPAVADRTSAPIVPPGWDQRLLARVAKVEYELDGLRESAAAQPNQQGESEHEVNEETLNVTQREQERLEHYQRELEYRAQLLAEHDEESTDDGADTQAASIRHALLASAAGEAVNVKDVGCRSKSCVAVVSFSTPNEALEYLHTAKRKISAVTGVRGMIATPTPPTSDGPYDLSIVYFRR